jgi:cell division protein FtsI (penicillin-binding protein 3)
MIDIKTYSTKKIENEDFSSRRRFLLFFMLFCMVVLFGRAAYLQVLNNQKLQKEGDERQVDEVSISAYRGIIKDRNGAPLAVSTPVETISINPKEFREDDKIEIKHLEKEKKNKLGQALTPEQKDEVLNNYHKEKVQKIAQMEKVLDLSPGKMDEIIRHHAKFAIIARRINPKISEQVKKLKLAGVYFDREFKRYYPSGGVCAHIVGFTNVEDAGQEGLESGYENMLKGVSGSKRVIRDGQRQIIEDVENIKEPIAGKDLELSIDQRIQYLAYRELQQAVTTHKAKSAALVVLDAKNGEILAAVNQPSFNPNTRKNLKEHLYRNRALTDVFEPGSTIKPFVVAAALEGQYIKPGDFFQTRGVYAIGDHEVKDVHNYGTIDVTHVLKKSSNIGVSQIALKMPAKYFWKTYRNLGIGTSAGSGFPGEASGSLTSYKHLNEFGRATLSFGYGLNTSALQLARAYTALADDGILHSVSILKREEDDDPVRVFSAKTAKTVRAMLETVIEKDGTAYEARVDGYSVAGKTGTVKKAREGGRGYTEKSYFSVFAGFAPAKNPKVIIVVMIDEPSAGQYYGGLVSAPVFSRVMAGTLRLLDIPPDQQQTMPILLTAQAR